MDEVARFYGVDLCILTWRAHGELCFKAGSLMGTIDIPRARDWRYRHDYQLYNHTIPWALPVIIDDVQKDEAYKRVTLPQPLAVAARFYAAAPLLRGETEFIGTLCIVDSKPRSNFGLDDANALVEKARQLVAVAKGVLAFEKA
jgi:GAF domain-containing protein